MPFAFLGSLSNVWRWRASALLLQFIVCGWVASAYAAPVPQASWDRPRGERSSVEFSAQILLGAQPGDEIQFAVGGAAPVRLITERLVTGSDGAVTWVGFDPQRGRMARSYVTMLADEVSGEITSGSTRYDLSRMAQHEGVLTVKDLAASGMTRFFSLRTDSLRVDETARMAASANAPPIARELAKITPTPQTTIDMAVFYTQGMVTRWGSAAGVVARINLLLTTANDAYANSEVAITLRLVRTELTTYSDTGLNDTALQDFSGFSFSPFGEISPLPALATSARPIRNAVGADIMVLLRPLSVATQGGCGVAWVGDSTSNLAFDSQFGYAVVSDYQDGSSYCPITTFAHEVGHNMGLDHDRANAGSASGATSFAYGYGLNYTGARAALGDIMSYAAVDAPFFSSPNVRCNVGTNTCTLGGAGTPLGVAGDADFGACTTNPSSCADGARTLNLTRAYIASFRAPSNLSITGTISNGATPVPNATVCARPSTGVSCSAASNGTYACTVPNGWTGLLHAHAPTASSLQIREQSFTNVTSNQSGQNPVVRALGSCNLDVDNNGLFEPDIDGVAILRRVAGLNAGAFSGLSGACAGNTTAASVYAATNSDYNVTLGAGGPRLLSDGLIISRAMKKLTGTAVTNGATSIPWSTLQSWLNTHCGTTF